MEMPCSASSRVIGATPASGFELAVGSVLGSVELASPPGVVEVVPLSVWRGSEVLVGSARQFVFHVSGLAHWHAAVIGRAHIQPVCKSLLLYVSGLAPRIGLFASCAVIGRVHIQPAYKSLLLYTSGLAPRIGPFACCSDRKGAHSISVQVPVALDRSAACIGKM